MSKILVTGGAGFVGSHIVDALIEQGHEVTVIDNLSTGAKENVHPKARFQKEDIRESKVKEIIIALKPEAIFHLAAQIDVAASMKDPESDKQINVQGSVNIIDAAKQAGVKRFIFSSTGGAIYGETNELPTPETHEEQPISRYGENKLKVEKYLHQCKEESGFNYIALRYSNVYGPRQNSKGEAGVVAIFCDRALNKKPITIHGDGTITRDYVYVDDVVRANLLALDSDKTGEYNVGTGVETDVNQLATVILNSLNFDSEIIHGPPREGDVQKNCLDNTKIQSELGWEPTVNLKDGIAKTAEWFTSQV